MENNPYGNPPSPGPGDGGDFFGGSVLPRAPQAVGQPAFGVPAPAPAPKAASMAPWIVIAVVGALALAAAFFGYRMLTGSSITMPDTLMGLERIDPDSAIGQELERSFSSAGLAAIDIDLEVAGYTSGDRTLVVAAAETGGDAVAQRGFFSGLETGMKSELPGVTLKEVDAGGPGGRMQCFEMAAAAAGACAWISEETLGVVVTTGGTDDIASTTIEVRETIER